MELFKVGIINTSTKSVADIDLEESNNVDLMQLIINRTNMHEKSIGETEIAEENDRFMYQISYIENSEKDPNELASTLLGKEVNGNAVIFRYTIKSDRTCLESNVSLKELERILKKRQNTRGLIVAPGGRWQYIYFKNKLSDSLVSGFDFHTFEILGYHMEIFSKDDKKEPRNKTGVMLLGQSNITGPLVVTLRNAKGQYMDLTKNLFSKVIYVARDITGLDFTEDEGEMKNKDGMKLALNGHILLNSRIRPNSCKNCSKEIQKFFTCSHCYRERYCSSKCFRANWNSHKKTGCDYQSNKIKAVCKTNSTQPTPLTSSPITANR